MNFKGPEEQSRVELMFVVGQGLFFLKGAWKIIAYINVVQMQVVVVVVHILYVYANLFAEHCC